MDFNMFFGNLIFDPLSEDFAGAIALACWPILK